MNKRNIIYTMIVVACATALVGCQSVSYSRIGPGPELEYALAQCEINAMSTEQGMFAMGTPGYVFGAQLGNAITNEVRRQEYIRRCMVPNGWMQRPGSSARAGANSYEHPRRCSRVRHSSVVRQPAFLPGSETLPLIGLDNV